VELALIVPILAFLMMGILDFGVAYQRYVQLTSAVRDGARYGATAPTALDNTASADPNNIKYEVKREADSIVLSDSNVTIYYEVYGSNPPLSYDAGVAGNSVYAVSGNAIRVRVSYSYVPFTPYLRMLAPNGSFTVSVNAVMQIQ